MKKKLISRMKKFRKEKNLSYQELATALGFNSATTVHRYINTGIIPKNRFDSLNHSLEQAGY